jgi:7-carboxy-7-deazaguanine synthase
VNYPVNERFVSWQGEGVHSGKRAHFIRLQGCDLRCSWCDSSDTWTGARPTFSADELAADIPTGALVIVTGGEPCIHDLNPLCRALLGRFRHLETAGHRPITGNWAWVTLSPKPGKAPLPESVARADEFKVIVSEPDDIARGLEVIRGRQSSSPVWLHPEWSQRASTVVLSAIIDAVESVAGVRAGYQLHKLYGVR